MYAREDGSHRERAALLTSRPRRATEESILAVQIFDQKKFKKKDQGFLGVVNVRVGSVMDLDVGGDGSFLIGAWVLSDCTDVALQRCSPAISASPTTTWS